MIRYFLALIVLIRCSSSDTTPCPTKTCNDYKTQLEAQAAFDESKTCLKSLDDDNDGIACEQVACGCSSKTKAQCGDPCCKWTVGSGCGCK